MKFAEVAIFDLERMLLYGIPPAMEGIVIAGSGVIAPLGGRKVFGVVAAVRDESNLKPGVEIKEILTIFEDGVVIYPEQMKLAEWMSEYYMCSKVKALQIMIPGLLKTKGERFFSIADTGQEEFLILTPSTSRVLDILKQENRAVSYKEISKKLGLIDAGRPLLDLKKAGIISEHFKLPDAHFKTIKVACYNENSEEKIAGRVQKQIIATLKENSTVPLSLLNSEFNPASVAALVKKGIIICRSETVRRVPYGGKGINNHEAPYFELTPDQAKAVNAGAGFINKGEFKVILLHGVTASGKTEVYLRLAEETLKKGRSVIVLLPEIALTAKTSEKFKARFGDKVFILHSMLSDGERLDEWNEIRKCSSSIAVGARSALFAPVKDLGLIIVDEEHDGSYKQESILKYNARDMSVVRGKISDALVVLGSATPSVETFHNASTGKYAYFEMAGRVNNNIMPEIRIIDMRQRKEGMFSTELMDEMKERFEKNEQVLLFLNRRGFADSLICRECGYIFKCVNCSISLTFHKFSRTLSCHYCGYTCRAIDKCTVCGSVKIRELGFGTERVEEELKTLFPEQKSARMDKDTVKGKFSHLEIIREMEDGEASLLIGTQMVAKGHHLPDITLAAVLLADRSLCIPDFRAAERTFQLLVQVAGRAGRGEKKGLVIIQTLNPEHYSIEYLKKYDYKGFFDMEIDTRKELSYPPYSRLAIVTITGKDEEKTGQEAKEVFNLLKINNKTNTTTLMGPAPAPVFMLKKQFRWLIMLKSKDTKNMRTLLKKLEQKPKNNNTQTYIDIDPSSFA